MDFLLGQVTKGAMNYAIKTGIAYTAGLAIKQSNKLIQGAPKSQARDKVEDLKKRLENKIRVVSPAIDMIELIAARGNTSLESAIALTRELRLEIQEIATRFTQVLATSGAPKDRESSKAKQIREANAEQELEVLAYEMKQLLVKIDDAIPLMNLALTTSGAKLSTTLPSSVSPSRLLQASTFLTTGDQQYALSPNHVAQIGPVFTLSVYMLFEGHKRPSTEEEVRQTTWKEIIHKAKVKMRRVPLDVLLSTGSGSEAVPSKDIYHTSHDHTEGFQDDQIRAEHKRDEFAYQMMIIEDLDDGRVHDDFGDGKVLPGPFDEVDRAGIREMIPVHEISKIFYADTSKVLNINQDSESNHPVLLLRRDTQAVPPRKMYQAEKSDGDEHDTTATDGRPQTDEEKRYVEEDHSDRDSDPYRLPPSLDPEWIAFEVFQDPMPDSDGEDEFLDAVSEEGEFEGVDEGSQIATSMSKLSVDSPQPEINSQISLRNPNTPQAGAPPIQTSLSMLELLLRLASLQQFQQQSHLTITDELLNFFLEESSSTGAGGDEGHRQAMRADARRRVGWDPYNESPIKRHGEQYQYGSRANTEYYESPRTEQVYQSFYEDVTSPNTRDGSRQGTPKTPQPSQVQAQSRSITGTPENFRASNINNRPAWLRQPEQAKPSRVGSPLRPSTGNTDEGIGTSPGSIPEAVKQDAQQAGGV